METAQQKGFFSFTDNGVLTNMRNTDVRKGEGCPVESYMELAEKVARIQFMNHCDAVMFRGQNQDFRNRMKNTSIKPSLLRPDSKGINPTPEIINNRFSSLKLAEEMLVRAYTKNKFLGKDRFIRTRILRWAILQHYEVCITPLLDVTHSLRIAVAFATLENSSDKAYLYVLDVPNLSGAITTSVEQGIQCIRLSSICPSEAMRPHIQEGYLLSDYPESEFENVDRMLEFGSYEIDFGVRLIGKFYFHPVDFFCKSPNFPQVAREALYPNGYDPLYDITQDLKREIL